MSAKLLLLAVDGN